MKKILFAFSAFFIFNCISAEVTDKGQEQQVVISSKTHTNGQNHSQWNIPADMPDVYYNNVTGIITIVDYVNATYYVTIIDDWNTVVLTDTKVGGGTIDVSSLSSGDYTIDITTSWNHEFTGDFFVP